MRSWKRCSRSPFLSYLNLSSWSNSPNSTRNMARQRLAKYPPSSTEPQWFFTREELDNSPSIQQGMDWKEERRNRQRMIQILWQFRSIGRLYVQSPPVSLTVHSKLRNFGFRFSWIQASSWNRYCSYSTTEILYEKLVPAMGQIRKNLFSIFRNWKSKTDQSLSIPLDQIAVAAAYFLASKVEERPVNSKNVTSILRYLIDSSRTKGEYKFHESEFAVPDFIAKRKEILRCEETMLRMECFDMNLRHPHPLLGKLVKRVWSKGKGPEVVKDGARVLDVSWCVVNDTWVQLVSPACCQEKAEMFRFWRKVSLHRFVYSIDLNSSQLAASR